MDFAVRRIGASSSGGAAFRTIIPRLNLLLREPDRRNRPAPGMAPMEIQAVLVERDRFRRLPPFKSLRIAALPTSSASASFLVNVRFAPP